MLSYTDTGTREDSVTSRTLGLLSFCAVYQALALASCAGGRPDRDQSGTPMAQLFYSADSYTLTIIIHGT